jgi:hypothetical protein
MLICRLGRVSAKVAAPIYARRLPLRLSSLPRRFRLRRHNLLRQW